MCQLLWINKEYSVSEIKCFKLNHDVTHPTCPSLSFLEASIGRYYSPLPPSTDRAASAPMIKNSTFMMQLMLLCSFCWFDYCLGLLYFKGYKYGVRRHNSIAFASRREGEADSLVSTYVGGCHLHPLSEGAINLCSMPSLKMTRHSLPTSPAPRLLTGRTSLLSTHSPITCGSRVATTAKSEQRTTMLVELDEEHTKCSICVTKFSSDRDNQDPAIRNHLPVLSSSQRCDHWFCHGCILREQLRVADENNGRIPKWIKCMHCRASTSFNPAAPKYHRLLIDLLARAQIYAAALVKVEESSSLIKRENEVDEREVKRLKLMTHSPPLIRVKEEQVECGDQSNHPPPLESPLMSEINQSVADSTNNKPELLLCITCKTSKTLDRTQKQRGEAAQCSACVMKKFKNLKALKKKFSRSGNNNSTNRHNHGRGVWGRGAQHNSVRGDPDGKYNCKTARKEVNGVKTSDDRIFGGFKDEEFGDYDVRIYVLNRRTFLRQQQREGHSNKDQQREDHSGPSEQQIKAVAMEVAKTMMKNKRMWEVDHDTQPEKKQKDPWNMMGKAGER